MKTVIIYTSLHQGNTKRLVESLAHNNIDIIDILSNKDADISEYDCIGIASGIAYGKYYPQMLEYLSKKMPKDKMVFFIHTAGDPKEKHNAAAKAIADNLGCKDMGTYYCKGFDTYGPWKLIGGINKNRPNSTDITNVQKFLMDILSKCSLKLEENN